MVIFLSIIQYFVAAAVDVMDKFLISREKVQAVNYTFFTVVTGAALLVFWPWVYSPLPAKFIVLNLLSGVLFSGAMYVFFKALSQGEVSRVIPFIFGLVPVCDLLLAKIFGHGQPQALEMAAIFLLVPGALIISHSPKADWGRHIGLKLLSAASFSLYFLFWQYSAQEGPVLNNLMWNRLGAALILVVLLLVKPFRQKVFEVKQAKDKKQTGWLFLLKQAVGGANFIFYSVLLAKGKISVINSLQGFRYAFVFLLAIFLSRKFKKILNEEVSRKTINQKLFGLCLIFFGALILFL